MGIGHEKGLWVWKQDNWETGPTALNLTKGNKKLPSMMALSPRWVTLHLSISDKNKVFCRDSRGGNGLDTGPTTSSVWPGWTSDQGGQVVALLPLLDYIFIKWTLFFPFNVQKFCLLEARAGVVNQSEKLCVQRCGQLGKSIFCPCSVNQCRLPGRGRVWVQCCAPPSSSLYFEHFQTFGKVKKLAHWALKYALYLDLPVFNIRLYLISLPACIYMCVFK